MKKILACAILAMTSLAATAQEDNDFIKKTVDNFTFYSCDVKVSNYFFSVDAIEQIVMAEQSTIRLKIGTIYKEITAKISENSLLELSQRRSACKYQIG